MMNFNEVESELLLNTHHDRLNCLTVVGNHFVSSYFDSKILFWDVNSDFRRSAEELKGHTGAVFWTTAIDDSHFLSCSEDTTVRLWSLNRKVSQVIGEHNGYVNHVSLHQKYALSGSADGTVKLWDLQKKKDYVAAFRGHSADVTCCASLSGVNVVSGAADGETKIWDITKEACVDTIGGKHSVYCMVVISDKLLVRGEGWTGKEIQVVDLRHSKVSLSLRGHKAEVKCLHLAVPPLSPATPKSPFLNPNMDNFVNFNFESSRFLMSGSYDKNVCIWDMRKTEAPLKTLPGHEDVISSVFFYRERIVTSSWDKTVRSWKVCR